MTYTLELVINKPRTRIAELFGNPQNLAYWQPGFISIESLADQGKSLLIYKHGKRRVEMIETVVVDKLPEEFSGFYEVDGMKISVENHFEELGDGRTRWTTQNEAEVRGFVMRLMVLIMPGCFRKQSFTFMKNFKAFAETGADVRES